MIQFPRLQALLLLLLVSGGAACGFTAREAAIEPSREPAAVATDITPGLEAEPPAEAQPGLSALELVWAVPAEPVEGFVIYSGYNRGTLRPVKRIKTDELTVTLDPTFGSVYRTTLVDSEPQRDILIGIAAFNGEVESPLSDTLPVKGGR